MIVFFSDLGVVALQEELVTSLYSAANVTVFCSMTIFFSDMGVVALPEELETLLYSAA